MIYNTCGSVTIPVFLLQITLYHVRNNNKKKHIKGRNYLRLHAQPEDRSHRRSSKRCQYTAVCGNTHMTAHLLPLSHNIFSSPSFLTTKDPHTKSDHKYSA